MTWKSASALVKTALLLAIALTVALTMGSHGAQALNPSAVTPRTSAASPTPPEEVYLRQVVGTIGSGKDVSLQGTTVTGPVMTGRSIRGAHCVTADLIAAQRVELDDCQSGNVIAGQFAVLRNSRINGYVQAVKYLDILNSHIAGDALASGAATIQDASIDGILTVYANSLTLTRVTVGGIRMGKSPLSQSPLTVSGATVTRLDNGRTLLRLGSEGASASVSGFQAQSGSQTTTLTTPEGFRFQNGRCAASPCGGFPSYDAYLAMRPAAPLVEGPGWESSRQTAEPTGTSSSAALSVEYLALEAGSVVKGDVIFASGAGRVLVKPGARIEGSVVGGRLQAATAAGAGKSR
ncbi:MAG: hypothetical protein IPK79_05825 [Vampirovibrionales bacterium]|nr:hypothetical protein [Vampirovibrionales bacterium]